MSAQPPGTGTGQKPPAAARRASAGRTVPALDGVRALAIAAALADHGGVDGLRGGFIGVDIFFVLSGFLITSLLLAELDRTGRIDLAGFWTRRARRLLPALVVMVVVVGLASALFSDDGLFPDDAVAGLRADALAALGWVANWRFAAARTDYFAQGGTASPLQHTWSLGVEEQYYLLWPLLLVAVAAGVRLLMHRGSVADGSRVDAAAAGASTAVGSAAGASRMDGSAAPGSAARRRAVGVLAAVGAALSAAAAVVLTGREALSRVYFGTDTRAQALLLGAFTAAVLAPRWGRPPVSNRSVSTAGRFLMLGGLTALAVALLRATGTAAEFSGGLLTGVAVASAAVVAGVLLDPAGPLTRALAVAPLVWLGRISYGVYLWHWPVFLVLDGARTGITGLPLFTIRCGVTLLVALASWVLLEQPVRRWRPVPRRVLPAVAAAVMVAAALVVVAVPAGVPVTSATALPPGIDDPDGPAPAVRSGAATPAPGPTSPGPTSPGPTSPGPTSSGAAAAAPLVTRPATSAPVSSSTSAAAAPTTTATSARATVAAAATTAARRDPNRPLRVAVFGDSIAWTLMRYLPPTPGVTFVDHTVLGCGIARGGPYRYFGDLTDQRAECDAWPQTWATQVGADRPDMVLLLVGRWETMDRMHDGRWMHLGDPAYDGYLSTELGTAMGVLRSTGAQLVVANEPYNRRGEQPDGSLFPEDDPVRVDRWNTLVRGAASVAGVDVLDLHSKLCPDGKYTRSVDGLRVRSDGVHLTPDGVAWLTPWLVGGLRSMLR